MSATVDPGSTLPPPPPQQFPTKPLQPRHSMPTRSRSRKTSALVSNSEVPSTPKPTQSITRPTRTHRPSSFTPKQQSENTPATIQGLGLDGVLATTMFRQMADENNPVFNPAPADGDADADGDSDSDSYISAHHGSSHRYIYIYIYIGTSSVRALWCWNACISIHYHHNDGAVYKMGS